MKPKISAGDFVATSSGIVTEDFLQEKLTEYLHGSGFDGTWEVIKQKNKNFLCSINFHCMNENGFYDGWITLNYHVCRDLEQYYVMCTAGSYHRRRYVQPHDKEFYWQQFEYPLQKIRNKVIEELIQNLLLVI